jgi:hypothetical protein
MEPIKLGKGKPLTPALCELHYQAEKEVEQERLKIMGMAEVADRLGWKKQQLVNYLNRAEAKGFPTGSLPKPFQRIAAGWLWDAEEIEKYAKERGIE